MLDKGFFNIPPKGKARREVGKGKREGYRYVLNANSTVGRVNFGADVGMKLG